MLSLFVLSPCSQSRSVEKNGDYNVHPDNCLWLAGVCSSSFVVLNGQLAGEKHGSGFLLQIVADWLLSAKVGRSRDFRDCSQQIQSYCGLYCNIKTRLFSCTGLNLCIYFQVCSENSCTSITPRNMAIINRYCQHLNLEKPLKYD